MIATGARKSLVRERIARRRREMALDAACVLRPVAQIDQGLRLWQNLPAFARGAAVPLMLGLAQVLVSKVKAVRGLLRWAPVALSGWRIARGFWRGTREAGEQG